MKLFSLRFVLSLAVGLSLLYFTLQFVEIDKVLIFIKNARFDYLLVSFLLVILAYFIRGYRWTIWEKNLKYWDSFKLLLIGFMGNNVLPARLGEILRAHCAAQKTGEGYGRTAALASVAIERVLDGLVLSAIAISALILFPVTNVLFQSLLFVSLLFGLVTVGLTAGIFFHERIRKVFTGINKMFPGHLTKFGKDKINFFLDGLLLIKSFSKILKAILLTVLVWGIEITAYYLLANAVFDGVSLEVCSIFLVVVNFASLFPFTVAGVGAVEGAATACLISAGIPGPQSLAMVLIIHAYQFAFTTLAGGIFYFTGKYYNISILRGDSREPRKHSLRKDTSVAAISDAHKQLMELSRNFRIEARPKRKVDLSIVIPAYNEQNRLPKTILETIEWCKNKVITYELIIVDDGSSDDTYNLAKLFTEQVKDIRFIACPHLGKGAAVRMGMLNAVGKNVLFMDADGATPLDEIPKMIAQIEKGSEVVIGSRVAQNLGEIDVVSSLHRRIIGRSFAALVNIFVIPGFADTQCGFKMFRQEITKDIFSIQKLNGFAFDVEILYIARKLSLSTSEIPVNWINQKGSKVNIMTDSIKMLFDILRIRWLHRGEKFEELASNH